MKQFTCLFDLIDQTQSTNDKVQYIKSYFEQATSADAAWALFFLSGCRLKRFIPIKLLYQWCIEKSGLPDWLVYESYEAVGDAAETLALILKNDPMVSHGLSMSLFEWMEKCILPLRLKSPGEQKQDLFTYWETLDSKERFVLNKILTGDFRMGVSHLLTLKGLSQAIHISVETLSQRLMGQWEPTADFFDALKISEDLTPTAHLNPYPFYLASPLDVPLEKLGEPKKWQAEWKWDGIRAQCIHRRGKCALWSRGNELISSQFPEILQAMAFLPEGTVLDGEILAFKNDRPMSFNHLQKRLGRKKISEQLLKEIPVVFMVYDILEYQNQDMRAFPLIERRSLIESSLTKDPRILISKKIPFRHWSELSELRKSSRDQNAEGLMLKKLDSGYGVGRQRGNWWKFKIDAYAIDAVLIYAQAGQGRRANQYTDYTFGVWSAGELVPIAKAYSGLTQIEIEQLDRWIRKNTEEKFGPARKVKPEQVFEIVFEGIQFSKRHKSGVALRFPRIARWRQDKPPNECDTLEQIKNQFLKDI